MSAPKVAKSYLPAINVAVEHASASLTPEEGEQFDVFIARLAFDMFCMVALGKHMRTVTPDMAAPSDMKFVQNTMNGFSAAGILTREPHKRPLARVGLSRRWNQFVADMDAASERSYQLAEELWDELHTEEKDSTTTTTTSDNHEARD